MAPITINRNPYNALVDDSGNNLDGSLWDKLAIRTVLLDPIDAALAKIPVDVGTGKIPDSALSANVALKNIDNNFVAQSLAVSTTVRGPNGVLLLFDTSAPVDQKVVRFLMAGGLFYLQHMTDAGAALGTFTIDRLANIAAFGGQIAFPTTQNPSASANVLDDYEEGSWTPTDVSGAALALVGAVGTYVKVGQQVTIGLALTFPATSNAASINIGGVPFSFHGVGSVWGGAFAYMTIGGTGQYTIAGPANTNILQILTRLAVKSTPPLAGKSMFTHVRDQ